MVKPLDWDKHWEGKGTIVGRNITKQKKKLLYNLLWQISPYTECFSVLEVGSGEGHLTEELEKWVNGGATDYLRHYQGIDYSKKSVKICKSKGLDVRHGDLFDVKTKYNLVMSDGLLEHFLDFPRIVKKMCKVSKEWVLVIQPDHESFTLRMLLVLESLVKSFSPSTKHRTGKLYEYNFRMKDYEQEFKKNGFRLHCSIGVFFNGYKFLLFQKC